MEADFPLITVRNAGSASDMDWRMLELTMPTRVRSSRQSLSPKVWPSTVMAPEVGVR